ncbi:hypothetical protein AUR64_03540 [Haloprofundus marisrubri]|uniref:Halobacterial output domain-containing protein n=1 Tax=Haloprofundus marisrubri TaxID=1514971 RepID=A0A0W1RDR7_9EURY|nr:HalOD1 output domain-containing protein [Haloprofundus marisrubri]KTG11583.1 hypothetical protein AUR64_03540 [Haloprofundus marisrubri]
MAEQSESVCDTVASQSGFQAALSDLVSESESNAVDIRGHWEVSWGDDQIWEVEITSVDSRSTTRIENSGHILTSVIETVAEKKGVDAQDLPVLFDVIDPDIFEAVSDESTKLQYDIRFPYCGYQVTVSDNGIITVDG